MMQERVEEFASGLEAIAATARTVLTRAPKLPPGGTPTPPSGVSPFEKWIQDTAKWTADIEGLRASLRGALQQVDSFKDLMR